MFGFRRKQRAAAKEEPEPVGYRISKWFVAALIVCVLFIGTFGFIVPEQKRLRQMDMELADLAAQRDALEEERDAARSEVLWLRSAKGFLETIARDKLGMRREGEKIIRISDEK